MMTLREIDEVEARANAATPGPWEYERGDEGCSMGEIASASDGRMFKVCGDSAQQYHNADFIAAARTDMPALCETARRAIGLLREARNYIDPYRCDITPFDDFLAQVTKETPK